MAIKDGKKVNLTEVTEEAQKEKQFDTIEEASGKMFASMPTVINEALRRGKQKHKGDFFIEVFMEIKKFVVDTVEPHFFVTRTCPNPRFQQMALHYTKEDDKLRLLWVLPDQFHAAFYKLDPLRFPSENVKYLFDLNDGTLQSLADNINKNIK